jgi:excisionase family DNA binding protein
MDEQKRAVVLSVADLAAEIGKSELAARRMIERGQIPARRMGDRIVILRSDLEEFLGALPWDRRFERRRSAAES